MHDPGRQRLSLRVLLGTLIFFSVVMLISLWTKLSTHKTLRRSSYIPLNPLHSRDLFTLAQHRRNMTNISKSDFLHVDDLAHSASYTQWAPVIVTKCMHGMDKRSAPCIKEAKATNLIEAQELIYPAFRLRLPSFVNSTMKAKWLAKALHVSRMRVSEDQKWADYPTSQGQNMIFSNAAYRGNPPPDIWTEKGCMGHDVSHASFMHELNQTEETNKTNVGTLIVATSPDSWSFQHFIDRVAVVWSQAQLVIPTTRKNDTVIVSGRIPRDAIVDEIYNVMVGQHLHSRGLVTANRLVFSCRAPLIHPFTTQRISENILQTVPVPSNVSESNRNIILILSRSKGGKAFNGGRQILNEPELVDAISLMLNTTNRPETLQYFRHDQFNGLADVVAFMRDRVKMMIGPHGAAFYNARFALPRTALIEIIPNPDKFFEVCFWEQARLLGQDYSAYVGNTTTQRNDMVIDNITELVGLVQKRLEYVDHSYQTQDALAPQYSWDVNV